jgi:hypothetical protein
VTKKVGPYVAQAGYAVGRPYKLPGKRPDLVEAFTPKTLHEARAIKAALLFYEEALRNEADDSQVIAILAQIGTLLARAGVAR